MSTHEKDSTSVNCCVTTYLSPDEYERLKNWASAQSRTISNATRLLIMQELDKRSGSVNTLHASETLSS